MRVGNEATDEIDNEIGGTAMARMLNLRDIFQLINDGAFAQEKLVGEGYEAVLHIFLEFGDQLQTLFEEGLGQSSADVASIAKEFAMKVFDKAGNRTAIIDIAWGKASSSPRSLKP
jgi:hypothetical protein